jgi:ATP-dependent Clp endopeptidase proteolytic subunit ClpP
MTDLVVAPSEQELRKYDAEAEKALAEAAYHKAQARKAEAEARKAELDLVAAEEKEQARLKSDDQLRLYQFNEQVSAGSVGKCMSQLRLWDRLDPECDIEIIFNSPGGSVIDGMALLDLIVRMSKRGGGKHLITVGAQGYAASMAGILLQSGDVRWLGRQSYLMIHEVSAGASGKIGEIKDEVKFLDAICARVVDIFVERSGKISKKTFINKWTRQDWWLLSDEALKLGFVDEVR